MQAGAKAHKKRIQNKYVKIQARQKRHITKFGQMGTGDHIVMTDEHGKGGIFGSKYLYTHYDIATSQRHAIPQRAMDDLEMLKAMNGIYADSNRGVYRADNWKSLKNAAETIGLTYEPSQP